MDEFIAIAVIRVTMEALKETRGGSPPIVPPRYDLRKRQPPRQGTISKWDRMLESYEFRRERIRRGLAGGWVLRWFLEADDRRVERFLADAEARGLGLGRAMSSFDGGWSWLCRRSVVFA